MILERNSASHNKVVIHGRPVDHQSTRKLNRHRAKRAKNDSRSINKLIQIHRHRVNPITLHKKRKRRSRQTSKGRWTIAAD
uniref:Uncharacterized protein n=1 Tax=Arion vulgaris TaxID=1028688 RepID=A0A0B7ATJ9_9EUPU